MGEPFSALVRDYVRKVGTRFPDGIELFTWNDESLSLRARLSSLSSNTFQGGVLVLILLGLTLRPALAFWIAVGIPVALSGGLLMMPWVGGTANMMSLFGFFIVIGIVGDDAIVTGENIYANPTHVNSASSTANWQIRGAMA